MDRAEFDRLVAEVERREALKPVLAIIRCEAALAAALAERRREREAEERERTRQSREASHERG